MSQSLEALAKARAKHLAAKIYPFLVEKLDSHDEVQDAANAIMGMPAAYSRGYRLGQKLLQGLRQEDNRLPETTFFTGLRLFGRSLDEEEKAGK